MNQFDLDTILLKFPGKTQEDDTLLTIRDAVEGIQIFGGIGSGKTSGSGRTLALKFLSHKFGGLVLTAKPDEKALWQQYCRQTGRLDDLIVIEPGGDHYFNFLEYESLHSGMAQPITENIVQVLKTVIQASEQKSSQGRGDDAFWENALDMLMFNVIDLCSLAYDKILIKDLYNIVLSAPKKTEEPTQKPVKPKEEGKETVTVESTYDTAYIYARDRAANLYQIFKRKLAAENYEFITDKVKLQQKFESESAIGRQFSFVDTFFGETFKDLSDKTRSIVEFSFSGFLFRLLREPIYSLFCNRSSTVTPDDCLEGKIILLNLPVKLYHKTGRDCQILFKYIWQRAMERRNVTEGSRPVFLWADEAQNFLHEYDADYQATARSSLIATVYISQNLPNYYANMGGQASEHKVKSFLGTLATKIFHANADIETNTYASNLIGEGYAKDASRTTTTAGKDFSSSKTENFTLEKMVRPESFASLKTGGPRNNFRVEGYLHRQGNPIYGELNHRLVKFNQQSNI